MMKEIDVDRLYDVIVVGGGPAGLTAALYLARARYKVLVVEKGGLGGQITITSEVVNYPGVLKASGTELTETMRRQAQNFGAEFLTSEVEGFTVDGHVKTVQTARGSFNCFGILLATGARPRLVGFKGEEQHRGRGVAYCSTCDGEFFTGKEVFVVGGGFAAAEESVFLTRFARHVTVLIRGDDFTCAKSAADAAKNHEKITVLTNVTVQEVAGDRGLNYIRYQNTVTGQVTEYRADEGEDFGVFVFAGYVPASELARGIVELDQQGYIITDANRKTGADGVYAAGDVCVKTLRQVVTAVADGAIAATELEKYAQSMQRATGLKPEVKQPKAEVATESAPTDGLFSAEMISQMKDVFARMEKPLLLELHLDDSKASRELEEYMTTLAGLTEKLTVRMAQSTDDTVPCVRICCEDGAYTGLAFHGVPGGHEFTAFVMALFNVAGPGQSISDDISRDMRQLNEPVDMKVLVSLNCTMCPELVMAAQRLAAAKEKVTAEVYDISLFPQLKEKFDIMSVPCLVIDDSKVVFGKKNLRQLLEILSNR